MEHVGVVVDDLEAAIAFFLELGLVLDGETTVEGRWADRIVGLDGVRADIAVVQTPDVHGRLELSRFHSPADTNTSRNAPANAHGIRHVLFVVDDVDDVVTRLRDHGGELVGEIVQYEDSYLLCYIRGPEGIIVELAQELA
jgi:catechol 2,3-dioxygenase-like lactoylglutathione lyase family enzyme